MLEIPNLFGRYTGLPPREVREGDFPPGENHPQPTKKEKPQPPKKGVFRRDTQNLTLLYTLLYTTLHVCAAYRTSSSLYAEEKKK